MPTVLLVEDSKFFGKLVQKQITERLGFTVHWVQTYAEAVQAVATHKGEYLLGLLDLNLPDAPTGKSVELALSNQIPAIVFSAILDESVRNKIRSKKIIDYVLKQGMQDIDYLISLIQRIDQNRFTTILVVEDSGVSRRYICDLLRVHQYNLLEAENGEDALARIEAHPETRMVITDYEMPVMDGFELTKELRTRFKKDELSIIGISSQENHLLAAKFIKNGANDFVPKPFFVEEFYCRVTQNIEIIEHITRRKQIEQELRIAVAAAKDAAMAKSQFLANMSHEIRTPLHGIIGMAELARETNLDTQQQQIMSTIETEAGSLLAIINDILDFSKIEAKKFDLENMPFDLRDVFETVARNMSFNAHKRGVVLNAYLPPTLPTLLIGDMARLRQILVNLVGNALKFTFEGAIDIQGKLAADHGNRVEIGFTVKDTGIGISEDQQAAVFESFTQADGSTSRKYGGTGLGTTISKQLAEMMGGRMGLRSKAGEGSTFWFTAVFEKQSSQADPLGVGALDLAGKPVLIVATDPTNQRVLSAYLEWMGALPNLAADGKTALAQVTKSVDDAAPYECILIDLALPDMIGIHGIDKIRQACGPVPMPIVPMVLSGSIEHGDFCKRHGFAQWITKPVILKELISALAMATNTAGPEPIASTGKPAARDLSFASPPRDIHILLVEDYPTNQQVALRQLQNAGFRAQLAENGKQAVDAFQREHFDLILMDVQMPEMDGYAATRVIRSLEARQVDLGKKEIPIVAMTAHAVKSHRDEALAAGMNDFLTKPLKKKDLLSVIEKWVAPRTSPASHNGLGESTPTAPAPMDIERAVKEFEGDKRFLWEIMTGFMDNVRKQIVTLRQAVCDQNAPVLKKEAHSIKGGAGNLAAFELMHAAEALETMSTSDQIKEYRDKFKTLEHAFYRLEKYIETQFVEETQ